MTPQNLKYSKTHEWVKIEGTTAVVGITDHAQHALGDITFIELPVIGRTFEAGKECGVIESVKAASDLYTPVAGDVTEVNKALEASPELINQDAYGKGWLFKLKNVPAALPAGLLSAADYDKLVAQG
jgi:glycine cleavage system H protein